MKFDHYLVGDITIEDCKEICKDLLSRTPRKDISFFLASNGGDVDGALSVGSAIQSIQRQGQKVHIHVGGIAHSAAVLLLQFANHRTMEAYSTLRIHPMQALYGKNTSFTISDLNGELDTLSYAHYVYYEVLKRRTGREVEDILHKSHHLRQDVLLYPKDCLEWNLIDEVLDYCIPSPNKESTDSGNAGGNTVLDFTKPRAAAPSRKTARTRKKAS